MGNNNRKPSYFDIIYTISACIGVLVLIIGVAYNIPKEGQTENKAEDKKEYTVPAHNTVPINRLISDYDANEMRADELYEGKLLRVSGIVSDIRSSDIAGNPYVTIKSPEIFAPVIKCVFKDSNRLLKYSEGDKITVIGICTGLTVDGLVIYFDQCEDVLMPESER
ncbi:OB-fold protein [Alistipes ihumii]|uniref:OB-fold protein n=1 Tax=Alistipes ihumii TaxID=1470347 RepID=UPI00266027BF|nr:hypothetical protein [Alistipes ihumii]